MKILQNNLSATLALHGEWKFALGAEAPWHVIQVPGCWEAQGYSKWIDGPARYRRTVLIPHDWGHQNLHLELAAVSYACRVRCNGVAVGRHEGLWTPFSLDLSPVAQPGKTATIELEVERPGSGPTARYPLRTALAGFLPDVATPFGGLWQPARLRHHRAGLHDLGLVADVPSRTLQITSQLVTLWPDQPARLQVTVRLGNTPVARSQAPFDPQGRIALTVPLAEVCLWSPSQPNLYTVDLQVEQAGQTVVTHTERVGFRQLTVAGAELLLNGAPICLRGALSWGWDPQRIAPYYTAEQARAEIRRVRALGFNLIKLCLFVPNQTYFAVADEEGMLLWQEWPMWLPELTPALRAQAPQEYTDYMQLTRHHPAVVIYSLGCELDHSVDQPLLQELDQIARQAATGVLFCDNSGSGEAYGGLAVDFADFSDYHTYGDIHFLELTLDHWRRDWQRPRPWIFGEFCDSDGFRDLAELTQANGGVKPWWLTADIWTHTWRPEVKALLEQDERLAQANSGFSPAELVRIANAQSYMVRKFTLEAVRKRAAVKGYVITGLRDTPIATSGLFDDLDRPKWPPDQFRPINDAAILCLDVGRSRRWTHGGDRAERLDLHNWWAGETVRLHLILNHTAEQPVTAGTAQWRVLRTNAANAEQMIAAGQIPISNPIVAARPGEVGVIEFVLPASQLAETFTLAVDLDSPAVQCHNRWPLWSYPKPTFDPTQVALYDPAFVLDSDWLAIGRRAERSELWDGRAGVVITTALDELLLTYLRLGGRALLLQTGDGPLSARRAPFWREAIKLLAPHPIWQDFPQQGFVDLQFFGLATDLVLDAAAMGAPGDGFVPLLRRLDARDFTLGEYLFEKREGSGRVIACALRLQGGIGAQPTGLRRNVAGQYLLAQLLAHLRA